MPRIEEIWKDIERYQRNSGNPADPTPGRVTLQEATLQGATRGGAHGDDGVLGASVDIDRERTVGRERTAPRVQVSLGTYTLAAGLALQIPLPRWCRSIIIQNNSDLGGTSAVVSRSIDGTPATPGDFVVRQGEIVSDEVYTNTLSLYCASAMTVNGATAGGLVVEVST